MKSSNPIYLIILLTALLCGCKDDDLPECQSTTPDPALEDIRDFIILPSYSSAEEKANDLTSAIEQFNLAPSLEELTATRTVLKTAWLEWQTISAFEFGPATDASLRANVNTFPADEPFIEQSINDGNFTLIANNSKGFPALDLLLNGSTGTDQDILDLYLSDVNSANRRQYLEAVASDIATRISYVKSLWQNDYGTLFVTNTGFSTGSSNSLYINAYVQDWEQIKRDRIALPLGLLTFQVPLPDRVECYYGGYSVELAMRHTLSHYDMYLSLDHSGIQELVQGVTSFSGENGETLDEAIIAQFELALEHLALVPDPLSESVVSDFDTVNQAYLTLQNMVVLLKTDMISGLGISINYGDTDGD